MPNTIPVRVTKRFTFEACHRLVNYKGACERMHGHSYKMEVSVVGIPNEQNLTMDFKHLKYVVNTHVINKVDHQDLNTVLLMEYCLTTNTTCEAMIVLFWDILEKAFKQEGFYNVKLDRIRLWETEDSYAELTRDLVEGGLGDERSSKFGTN